MNIVNQPVIRWAGSKRSLLPTLGAYWNSTYSRYVEPFAGSACLFFALSPERALINDINADLVSMYRTVRDRPDDVYNAYLEIPVSREHYYEVRDLGMRAENDVASAARFLYLNRNCFNGLYRTNRSGKFNVPFSDNRNGRILPRESFLESAGALNRALLLSSDFETVLYDHVAEGDFVYLDPPYAVRNTRVFTQYGPDTFGLADLSRLRDALASLDARQIPFLLSYADTPDARTVFEQWEMGSASVQRHISGFSGYRRRSNELLVISRTLAQNLAARVN